MKNMLYVFIYFLCISLFSVFITCLDKSRARCGKHKNRIPEATLFLAAAAGGSVFMYLTMLVIRHKTKHIKFMLGLPLIILAQVAIVVAVSYIYK